MDNDNQKNEPSQPSRPPVTYSSQQLGGSGDDGFTRRLVFSISTALIGLGFVLLAFSKLSPRTGIAGAESEGSVVLAIIGWGLGMILFWIAYDYYNEDDKPTAGNWLCICIIALAFLLGYSMA